ncbi:MAG: hypothetical protein Q9197_000183 [Variospora fuerteventurae]
MARGRKNKTGRGRFLGNQASSDGGHGSKYTPTTQARTMSKKTSFSLQDEANNTERHYNWKSDQRLRYSQVKFVSAGGVVPNASKTPRAKNPQTARGAAVHASPPHSPLASMKIGEHDELNSSTSCSDRQPGEFYPALSPMQTILGTEQDQHWLGARTFFFDDTTPSVSVRKDLRSPKLERSFSPAPSASSEEVIVFQGRGRAPQNDLQYEPPLPDKPSAVNAEVYQSPPRKTKYSSSTIVPSYSTVMKSPLPKQAQHLAQTSQIVVGSEFIGIELAGPATELSTNSTNSLHKGRRSQRWSEERAIFAVKENEALADYIEHMQDDDDIDIACSNILDNGGSLRNLSTDRESQINTDNDATEGGANSPPARRSKQDPNVTRGFNDEIDIDALTDGDSDDTVGDAQIAVDLLEHIDDMEDERDLTERQQARMTDEHIAQLLSKQEEFGLTSQDLLLIDGNDINEQSEFSGVGQDQSLLHASVTSKRSKQARKKWHHGPGVGFRPATLLADMLEEEPYGDFDIMDYDRPSLVRIPTGRRNAVTFEVPEVGLEASLQLAWEKDRSKKKIQKREREELRAQGLLANNGQVNLKLKYREGISIDEIKSELHEFMTSARQR